MSDEYRKIHVTVSEENYQLIRKVAYDNDATKSDVINFVIRERLGQREPEPPASEPTKASEQPSPPVPTSWSVTSVHRS